MLVSLLLFGMGHSAIQESIVLANDGAAVASVMFCLLVAIFLVVSITLSIYHSILYKWAAYSLFSLIVQHVGAVLYFVGDNLTQLVSRYGGDVEVARGASMVFFVLALMVFWITPPLSHLIRETHLTSSYEECTQSKKHWCNVIYTITVIIKVDVLYSAVLVMVDTTNDACTFASTYLLFLLCILVGMAYVFIKILVLWYDKKPAINYRRIVTVILIAIIGLVCFPLHTLMNNKLPLDCGFPCSEEIIMPAMNSSATDLPLCSVQRVNNGLRLSVTLMNLLTLTFFSLLFGSAYLTNRFKKEDFKKLMPSCCSCCTSTVESQGETVENEGNCFTVLYYWMSKFSWLIVDAE